MTKVLPECSLKKEQLRKREKYEEKRIFLLWKKLSTIVTKSKIPYYYHLLKPLKKPSHYSGVRRA